MLEILKPTAKDPETNIKSCVMRLFEDERVVSDGFLDRITNT